MILRDYQQTTRQDIYAAWNAGYQNVCAVLPTGAGKTVLFSEILREAERHRFAIAHRQELVCQMSLTLAKSGVMHTVQTTPALTRYLAHLHIKKTGLPWIDPSAQITVIGVRTLLNRADTLRSRINQTSLWVIDEAHHITRGNQWGKATELFPTTCHGLGVTATPLRADGKGLGRHADGVTDALVVGPSMRDLINRGYLTDYRIFAPPSGFDLSRVTVGSTGDYTGPSLKAESKRSRIMGDVVQHYIRIAPGKLGVTFVTDVETATETARAFQASGVPAEVLHAKTPERDRQDINDRLERGDLKQIVNVDILGEGYDCPAIEVCSMARPTESYGLFVQQFGRALRPLDGKTHAIIIDHVGNVIRHGLPDNPPEWTLDRREKRRSAEPTDAIPLRVCLSCSGVYERILRACPYCGAAYEPAGRQSPEQVDGDLLELDPAVLAALRGEVERVDTPAGRIGDRLAYAGAPEAAIRGAMANHTRRQQAQSALRNTIALWAGYQRAAGVPDWQSYRKFYARYGIDVLGAQALGRPDTERLNMKITEDLPV